MSVPTTASLRTPDDQIDDISQPILQVRTFISGDLSGLPRSKHSTFAARLSVPLTLEGHVAYVVEEYSSKSDVLDLPRNISTS